MSCDAAGPPELRAKKLPFKATALRRAASGRLDITTNDKRSEDDGLDLFRRSKEMEPIMVADSERRLKRLQKQDEWCKSAELTAKRPLDSDAERDVMTKVEVGAFIQKAQINIPVASEIVKNGTSVPSELVMPPASKRTRRDSTPPDNTTLDISDAEFLPDEPQHARLLWSGTKQATPSALPK